MKKYLLAALLLTSFSSFSNVQGPSAEGVMNITAKVIKPLTVKTISDMNFGTLVSGTKGNISSMGEFLINGEGGENVNISVKEFAKGADNGIILLKNKKGGTLLAKVSGEKNYLSSHTLRSDGVESVFLKSEMDIPKTQKSGLYSGIVTLNVRYE